MFQSPYILRLQSDSSDSSTDIPLNSKPVHLCHIHNIWSSFEFLFNFEFEV
uniref:Uncharacterized protein n=1 Tax=Arundo donax TaxID=35708 RepID=A0A0A8YJX1_ARUDO